jgi:hypothetical protein
MAKATSKYKFTDKDSDAIVALCYTFHGIAQDQFATFMRKNYPGFDLTYLLQKVENLMAPHAATPVTRTIEVDADSFQVCLENKFKNEDEALVFDRIFYKEKGAIKISHEFPVFPIPARNQELSKKVLKA